MKKNISDIFLLIAYFCIFSTITFAQTFGAERDFPKTIVLPDSVYKILLNSDKFVRENVKEIKSQGKPVKKTLFQSTIINLNNDKFPDLLVKGKSLLAGAHGTRFWVFKKTSKGYELVFTDLIDSFSVLKNISNRHKIIRSDSFAGSRLNTNYYRFDGKRYIFSWSKTKDI